MAASHPKFAKLIHYAILALFIDKFQWQSSAQVKLNGKFVEGSIMRHVINMTATGSIGLIAVLSSTSSIYSTFLD